jgi:hypothetical protein
MTYECIVWQSSMLKMRNENKSINLISAGKSDSESCAASLFWRIPLPLSAASRNIQIYVFQQHIQLSPIPSNRRRQCTTSEGKQGRDVREYPSYTHNIKNFPTSHTQTHTQGELFGVDGNEKKSKPFGSRRRAKAFWGCVKGVRVRICDKKWLYGSCTLKSFSFREKSMCRLLVAVKDSKSWNRKWTEWKFEFFSGK